MQLVGPVVARAGAVGKQIQYFFFDAVFHISPSAIKLLPEGPCRPFSGAQDGDHKPRSGAFVGPFGFTDARHSSAVLNFEADP